MIFHVLGIGTSVPERSLAQGEIADLVARVTGSEGEDRRRLDALFRRAGVRRRGSVLLGEGFPGADGGPMPGTAARMEAYRRHATDLAAAAGRRALADSAVDATEITHLVTASCTGFSAPGVDCALVDVLGLRRGVQRTHVGFMGCHAAFNALRVGAAFATADPSARVLVCCLELSSLHLRDATDPSALVSASLFADGAGAVVGAGGPAEGGPAEGGAAWRLRATGSHLVPGTEGGMTWRIRDDGFAMSLSPEVPQMIAEAVRGWLPAWLAGHGFGVGDVGSWAVHPGGPRILSAVENALDLPREAMRASREVLAEHGNMSSATVIFVLERLRASAAPRPCVALGFGPGLTCEAMLLP